MAGAGPIAATLALSTGLLYLSAAEDKRKALEEHKAQATASAAQWHAMRAPINKALEDAGIKADPLAGMTPEGARRFGSNKAESDKLEAAVRAHRFGTDGSAYQVSPAQAERIRQLGASWGTPGSAAGDAKRDPVPTLEAVLQAQLKGNAILQAIADKSGGPNPGPTVSDAGRAGIPAKH